MDSSALPESIPFDAPMGFAVPLVPRRFSSVSTKTVDNKEVNQGRRGSDVAAKWKDSRQRRRTQIGALQPLHIPPKSEESVDVMDEDKTPTATLFHDPMAGEFKEPDWTPSPTVSNAGTSHANIAPESMSMLNLSTTSLGSTLIDNASLHPATPTISASHDQYSWEEEFERATDASSQGDTLSIVSSETTSSQPKKRRGLLFRVLNNVTGHY